MCYFLEDDIKGYYKRGNFPHYDNDELYQFVTFRLHDSVPKQVLLRWKNELLITGEIDKNSDDYIKLERKIHIYEDNGYGECYLKNPLIYNIVKGTLERFDQERYDLIEWIIMPNHVHVLIKPYSGFSLPKIIHSWKSYTANKGNQVLNRNGKFWMEDYFDRYIRNEEHYLSVIKYIRNNGKTNNKE